VSIPNRPPLLGRTAGPYLTPDRPRCTYGGGNVKGARPCGRLWYGITPGQRMTPETRRPTRPGGYRSGGSSGRSSSSLPWSDSMGWPISTASRTRAVAPSANGVLTPASASSPASWRSSRPSPYWRCVSVPKLPIRSRQSAARAPLARRPPSEISRLDALNHAHRGCAVGPVRQGPAGFPAAVHAGAAGGRRSPGCSTRWELSVPLHHHTTRTP
jgi:hypothetical protein